jgi:TDG/mug DNA glycosylase family protein
MWRRGDPMSVLQDILAPELDVVFCGTAVGEGSAARGHYYGGPGNRFWQVLDEAGLTPVQLRPEDDRTLPRYGLGLTDLVKNVAQSHDRGLTFDMPALVAKLEASRPLWVAFTSKKAGEVAAAALGNPRPGLGEQAWLVADSRVFVLPSPSGANQRKAYDGRPSRLEWWVDLGQLVCGGATPHAT